MASEACTAGTDYATPMIAWGPLAHRTHGSSRGDLALSARSTSAALLQVKFKTESDFLIIVVRKSLNGVYKSFSGGYAWTEATAFQKRGVSCRWSLPALASRLASPPASRPGFSYAG